MKLRQFFAAITATILGLTVARAASWSWEATYFYPLPSPPPEDSRSRLWWTVYLQGPKFDESVYGGPLIQVEIATWTMFDVTLMGENVDDESCDLTFEYIGTVRIMRPDFSSSLTEVNVTTDRTFAATAFDQTIDYGGTSGVTYSGISLQNSSYFSSMADADLGIFRGSGLISLPAAASDVLYLTGSGNTDQETDTFAGVKVVVTYTYVPEPAAWGAVFAGLLVGFAALRRKSSPKG